MKVNIKVNIVDLHPTQLFIRREVTRYSDALSVGRTKQC